MTETGRSDGLSYLMKKYVVPFSLFMIFIGIGTPGSRDRFALLLAPYCFVGLWLFLKGFRELKKRYTVSDVPSSTVQAAAIGQVELQGTVAAPARVRSPGGLDCAFFRRVEYGKVRNGLAPAVWVKRKELVPDTCFYLDDGTGRVLVDPAGADLMLRMRIVEGDGLADDFKTEEGGLLDGGRVFVSGTLRPLPQAGEVNDRYAPFRTGTGDTVVAAFGGHMTVAGESGDTVAERYSATAARDIGFGAFIILSAAALWLAKA